MPRKVGTYSEEYELVGYKCNVDRPALHSATRHGWSATTDVGGRYGGD